MIVVGSLVAAAWLPSTVDVHASPGSPSQTGKLVSTAIDSLSFVPNSSEVWALGSVNESRSHPSFALRRRGGRWVQEPLVAGENNQLVSIAAGSKHSVWAVGATYDPSIADGFVPLIERSSGGKFRRVTPDWGINDGQLLSVSASSANNVWAAGLGPTLLHWNGHVWRPVTDDVKASEQNTLISVSTTGPHNVWAIAVTQSERFQYVHWNGKKWSSQPAPRGVSLTSIATTSRGRAWAVGYRIVDGIYYGYAAHLQGQHWTGSRALGSGSMLLSVSASGGHAFAVGKDNGSTNDAAAITEWTDGKWHREPAPHPRIISSLDAIAASSPKDVIAGGEDQGARVDGAYVTHKLTADYDGHHWSAGKTPAIRS